jgi:hypothetical protein
LLSSSILLSLWDQDQHSRGQVRNTHLSLIHMTLTHNFAGPLESSASGSSLLSPGLSSMGHVSPQSRSVTSSPPRFTLSTDQREVKRQSDRARRDSRLVNRMHRANSNPYADSSSSAMGLPSTTATMSLPAYTTAPAPVTLMSDTSPSMSSSTYLQSYSPTLEDQQPPSAPVYPTTYPQSL